MHYAAAARSVVFDVAWRGAESEIRGFAGRIGLA